MSPGDYITSLEASQIRMIDSWFCPVLASKGLLHAHTIRECSELINPKTMGKSGWVAIALGIVGLIVSLTALHGASATSGCILSSCTILVGGIVGIISQVLQEIEKKKRAEKEAAMNKALEASSIPKRENTLKKVTDDIKKIETLRGRCLEFASRISEAADKSPEITSIGNKLREKANKLAELTLQLTLLQRQLSVSYVPELEAEWQKNTTKISALEDEILPILGLQDRYVRMHITEWPIRKEFHAIHEQICNNARSLSQKASQANADSQGQLGKFAAIMQDIANGLKVALEHPTWSTDTVHENVSDAEDRIRKLGKRINHFKHELKKQREDIQNKANAIIAKNNDLIQRLSSPSLSEGVRQNITRLQTISNTLRTLSTRPETITEIRALLERTQIERESIRAALEAPRRNHFAQQGDTKQRKAISLMQQATGSSGALPIEELLGYHANNPHDTALHQQGKALYEIGIALARLQADPRELIDLERAYSNVTISILQITATVSQISKERSATIAQLSRAFAAKKEAEAQLKRDHATKNALLTRYKTQRPAKLNETNKAEQTFLTAFNKSLNKKVDKIKHIQAAKDQLEEIQNNWLREMANIKRSKKSDTEKALRKIELSRLFAQAKMNILDKFSSTESSAVQAAPATVGNNFHRFYDSVKNTFTRFANAARALVEVSEEDLYLDSLQKATEQSYNEYQTLVEQSEKALQEVHETQQRLNACESECRALALECAAYRVATA